MKRIVTFFIVLTMVLCLVACGGGDKGSSGAVYTGELDGETTKLTIKDGKAHFFTSFSETEEGLTMKAETTRIGVIKSNTDGVLEVAFFEEGAGVKIKMEISGEGADTYLELLKSLMLEGAELSDAEKAVVNDYFDGKEVTIDYGSALWEFFADDEEGYDTIKVELDEQKKTFTQVIEG